MIEAEANKNTHPVSRTDSDRQLRAKLVSLRSVHKSIQNGPGIDALYEDGNNLRREWALFLDSMNDDVQCDMQIGGCDGCGGSGGSDDDDDDDDDDDERTYCDNNNNNNNNNNNSNSNSNSNPTHLMTATPSNETTFCGRSVPSITGINLSFKQTRAPHSSH
eukprot:jgi/Psemu1/48713/gm1.48713_g